MFDFSGLFKKNPPSRDVAKERLKLVLINDRTGLSPRTLEELRVEITKVISKYLEIDEESLDIQMTNTRSEDGTTVVPALIANIPIKKVKGKATTRK
ncbi:MAG: cell division topological specificity factor MinE [Clostridiales bacterium]|jgi:cell division topological specificity factor|nr:cell division topological specificity factor MinE [Clostridiales bacterium]